MSQQEPGNRQSQESSRRSFLSAAALGGLGIAAWSGCGSEKGAVGMENRLRALCSNAGLKTSWCSQGKKAMELWGDLLNVEIVWVDGELNAGTQARNISLRSAEDWDYVCLQAVKSDALVNTVADFKDRQIPVMTMDVSLTSDESKMREAGVWCHVTADQVFMGESSTRYLVEKIGGTGKVIHIGGQSAHSGAQGRKTGFENVLREFADVEVAGGGIRWCDWEKEKAQKAFSSVINDSEEGKIAGCFCQSDDMALACAPLVAGTIHEGMIFTSVDGQRDGLEGIENGLIHATIINPVSLIHMTALALGQFIVRQQEPINSVPEKIITPGPLVSRETGNLEAMKFLADPRHCMV